jgi:hypothetical protein
MSRTLFKVTDVINALGGTKAVAAMFDLKEAAISVWRVNNAMPPHTFTKIASELLSRGMTADMSLWTFARKKSARRLETAE